jgi:hypothetical protein
MDYYTTVSLCILSIYPILFDYFIPLHDHDTRIDIHSNDTDSFDFWKYIIRTFFAVWRHSN